MFLLLQGLSRRTHPTPKVGLPGSQEVRPVLFASIGHRESKLAETRTSEDVSRGYSLEGKTTPIYWRVGHPSRVERNATI
jgi:hypothetical protein